MYCIFKHMYMYIHVHVHVAHTYMYICTNVHVHVRTHFKRYNKSFLLAVLAESRLLRDSTWMPLKMRLQLSEQE